MRVLKPDLCVIGAGSGGLSVAAGAVQLGASVVLIEGHKMGGDCLNYGCVPSKALLAAGRQAAAMRSGAPFGIAPAAPEVDFAAAKDRVEAVIAGIAPHDSQERFEGLGVTVLRDWARLVSPVRVVAGDAAIEARRFVIASGSVPAVPPIPGLAEAGYFTNETIFGLRDRPEHLLIIGGGPIGLEMAQAHRRLGSAVTVVEGATALGREDPELAALLLAALKAEGIAIIEGRKVEGAEGGDGRAALLLEGGERIEGSHLLVAVGRQPNLERLDPEAGRITVTKAGVAVDARLRSVSNRRVYAVGDAAGLGQFTHLAGYHAGVVIRSALFALPAKARGDHVPRATFTSPELAQVGMTEAEARESHGKRLEVLRFDYAENDRARAEGLESGRIKVMVVRGRPVGAGIVGAQAGELIALWALVLAGGMKIGAVANMVAAYPTLSEVSKRAAGQYYVPRLFENGRVKRAVRFIQRWVP